VTRSSLGHNCLNIKRIWFRLAPIAKEAQYNPPSKGLLTVTFRLDTPTVRREGTRLGEVRGTVTEQSREEWVRFGTQEQGLKPHKAVHNRVLTSTCLWIRLHSCSINGCLTMLSCLTFEEQFYGVRVQSLERSVLCGATRPVPPQPPCLRRLPTVRAGSLRIKRCAPGSERASGRTKMQWLLKGQ